LILCTVPARHSNDNVGRVVVHVGVCIVGVVGVQADAIQVVVIVIYIVVDVHNQRDNAGHKIDKVECIRATCTIKDIGIFLLSRNLNFYIFLLF
jgi:hypothetical protein